MCCAAAKAFDLWCRARPPLAQPDCPSVNTELFFGTIGSRRRVRFSGFIKPAGQSCSGAISFCDIDQIQRRGGRCQRPRVSSKLAMAKKIGASTTISRGRIATKTSITSPMATTGADPGRCAIHVTWGQADHISPSTSVSLASALRPATKVLESHWSEPAQAARVSPAAKPKTASTAGLDGHFR